MSVAIETKAEGIGDEMPKALAEPAPEISSPVGPALGRDRLVALDTLRGVAVLGILLMNIPVFALPIAAVGNPMVAGGSSDLDFYTWFIIYVGFEGKMRSIFSMLFGAGVILMTSRAESRGGAASIADIYYRRNLWLIVFGMVHAYFVWMGDILFYYGAIGLILYPLRKAPAWTLVAAGLIVLGLSAPKIYIDDAPRRMALEADEAVKRGETLTNEQKKAQKQYKARLEGRRQFANPTQERLQEEIDLHHGGYWPLFRNRAQMAMSGQRLEFFSMSFFDMAGMMVLGMGLMKFGVFSAQRSTAFYIVMAVLCYGVGLTLNEYLGLRLVGESFDPLRQDQIVRYCYEIGRVTVALGHVSLVMFIHKMGWLAWPRYCLAAVGQMALTNYLMTSVICVLVFEGFGLGWFNELSRFELYYVVAAVWAFLLTISPIWLHFFRFGPMEWVWRALTYWQLPPMLARRSNSAPIAANA